MCQRGRVDLWDAKDWMEGWRDGGMDGYDSTVRERMRKLFEMTVVGREE